VIVLIVLSPTFTSRNIIEGWQIIAIVAIMVVSVVFYGAFIFQRALKGGGRVGSADFSLETPLTAKVPEPMPNNATASADGE
jgi:hypothetical protein